jgi:pimeloyl-ACP methyl ester carboxylesterase
MADWGKQRFISTNGIKMNIYEAGEGFPVLLLHGFPELAYSWRYQLPALAKAGFHVIAPDMRGYGQTDKPEVIGDYDIHHLIGDMTGLLDELGLGKAVIVGHDWGGVIVWQMALMQPDRVERVIGLNTPFSSRSKIKPTEGFKRVQDGRFNYILYFQEPGRAEKEIMKDVRGWMERTLRGIAANKDFVTPELLDYFTSAFQKGGVTGPINYYRNFDRNWETTPNLAGKKISMPALMVCAEKDPILTPLSAEGMEEWIPQLKRALIKDCGHWTQQERPEETNRVLLEYLADLEK